MGRIRKHLTYANVISTLCLFLLLGGGTAVALSGSNTVFSDDIAPNQVYSADVRDDNLSSGGLAAIDLRPSSVGGSEIANGSVTRSKISAPAAFVSAGLPNTSSAEEGSPPTAEDCAQNNGWYNFLRDTRPRVGYLRDTSGMVLLQGAAVKCPTASNTVFTLQPGYRPTRIHEFPPNFDPVNGPIFVRPSGSVDIHGGSNVVQLNGIVFRCGPFGQNGCP